MLILIYNDCVVAHFRFSVIYNVCYVDIFRLIAIYFNVCVAVSFRLSVFNLFVCVADSFRLIVQATDSDQPPQSSNTTVDVLVIVSGDFDIVTVPQTFHFENLLLIYARQ